MVALGIAVVAATATAATTAITATATVVAIVVVVVVVVVVAVTLPVKAGMSMEKGVVDNEVSRTYVTFIIEPCASSFCCCCCCHHQWKQVREGELPDTASKEGFPFEGGLGQIAGGKFGGREGAGIELLIGQWTRICKVIGSYATCKLARCAMKVVFRLHDL